MFVSKSFVGMPNAVMRSVFPLLKPSKVSCVRFVKSDGGVVWSESMLGV